tara:strand:- start:1738 stop:1938 length:201 start_codon:yes stop_codon:yes gene_type:complete
MRKAGDLYRVIRANTHRPCQLGAFVVLLDKLGEEPLESIYWRALNLSTGNWHHYKIGDLEFISEGG